MVASRETLQDLAVERQLQPATLERVIRLIDILDAFGADTLIGPRVALKGGTALNVFHFDLDRLPGTRGVTMRGRLAGLRRAVFNLVDNAVKYGGAADVALTSEGGRIVISVEDRGPGIPRSEREKVFEPFYRIEGSRNPATGGVGLGLSVARSIAREHGGDIVLAARKGGGLSARLELPA